jgi:hypothetical protein
MPKRTGWWCTEGRKDVVFAARSLPLGCEVFGCDHAADAGVSWCGCAASSLYPNY